MPVARELTPRVSGLTLRDIRATMHPSWQGNQRGVALKRPAIGRLNGLPESPIDEVLLDNVVVRTAGGEATRRWPMSACVNVRNSRALGATSPVPPCFTRNATSAPGGNILAEREMTFIQERLNAWRRRRLKTGAG